MARTQADQDDLKKRGVRINRYAYVADSVQLGDGVEIGAHVHVEEGVTIGAGCRIGPGEKKKSVFIAPGAQIGERTEIDVGTENRCLIGAAKIGAGTKIRGAGINSGAVIGDDCQIDEKSIIRASAVMENGSRAEPASALLERCTLKTGAVLPERCVVKPGTTIEPGETPADQGLERTHDDQLYVENNHWSLPRSEEQHIHPEATVHPEANVHPTAYILRGAVIEKGAVIGAYAAIGEGATIGENATVEPQCSIGNETRIGAGTVLGEQTRIGEKTSIGDRTRIDPSTEINAHTTVGDDVVIKSITSPKTGLYEVDEATTGIGRYCEIGNKVEIGAAVTISGGTVISDGASIDRLCDIGRGTLIGENAKIGARTRMDTGGIEIEAGLKIPADSQMIPAGTKLDHANAKRYAVLEDHGLAETVTAAERAEKAEIARERTGAGVAVRGAGRAAGGAQTPLRDKQSRETPAGRTH